MSSSPRRALDAVYGHQLVAYPALLLLALTGGCGSSSSSAPANSVAGECTQGDTRACVGPGACSGGQECVSGGVWGMCLCSAGSGGSGGQAGASALGAGGAASNSSAGGAAGKGGASSGGAAGSASGAAGSGGAGAIGGGAGAAGAAGMAGAGVGGSAGTTSAGAAGVGGMSGVGGAAGASGASGAGDECGPKNGAVFAVETLDFGDGDSGQWMNYGFDLDGKVSTAASTDLCQPDADGTTATAYPDGVLGIDNSFGKNLLPVILSVDPPWATDVNSAIVNGERTTLIDPGCLPLSGQAHMIGTKIFDATALGATPVWDGTDVWPVAPENLSDSTNPLSSTLLFASGTLTGVTFDAGTNGTVVLTLPFGGSSASTELHLRIHAARMTLQLSADHTSVVAGMIGGVLQTAELIAEIKKIELVLGLCGSSVATSLETQVRQSSDILSDGTQDPQKTCDGISIGLGFTASSARIGSVGPVESPANACP